MQIRIYDVVPISPSLGMVAFVPGTKPLKAVVTDPALVPEASLEAADAAFRQFIATKGSGTQNAGESQHDVSSTFCSTSDTWSGFALHRGTDERLRTMHRYKWNIALVIS